MFQDQNKHHQKQPGTNGGVNNAKKFIAKGHDAILKNAQDAGDMIKITAISGEIVIGKLVNRDKFTITVIEDATGDKATFYKHAIESFKIVKEVH